MPLGRPGDDVRGEDLFEGGAAAVRTHSREVAQRGIVSDVKSGADAGHGADAAKVGVGVDLAPGARGGDTDERERDQRGGGNAVHVVSIPRTSRVASAARVAAASRSA